MWILFDCRSFPCCWTVAVVIVAVVIFAGASAGTAACADGAATANNTLPFFGLRASAPDPLFLRGMIRLVVAVAVAVAVAVVLVYVMKSLYNLSI